MKRLGFCTLGLAFLPFAVGNQGSCSSNPCRNGAICIANTTTSAGGYVCQCQPGWNGTNCDNNIDDCVGACENDGKCTDKVNGFSCECKLGFRGPRCEQVEYWTLQQWRGNECGGTKPWRCFRLQMNRCIDTGFIDGNVPDRKNWFGRLAYNEDSGKYSIDLCWGENKDDPEESCKCDNHYENIRRLGKNSLGPTTPGLTDSDRCHKLMRVTSSRLVNSTGKGLDKEENKQNVDCSVESGAVPTMSRGLAIWGFIVVAIQALVAAGQ